MSNSSDDLEVQLEATDILPIELWFEIAEYLELPELAMLARTSKILSSITDDNNVWYRKCNYNFPYQENDFDNKIIYKDLFKDLERRHYSLNASNLPQLDDPTIKMFKQYRKRDLNFDKLGINERQQVLNILIPIIETKDNLDHTLLSAIRCPLLLADIYQEKIKDITDNQKKLIWACSCNQIDEIKRLITIEGADANLSVNKFDLRGPLNPLWHAIRHLKLEAINTLFEVAPTQVQETIIADPFFEVAPTQVQEMIIANKSSSIVKASELGFIAAVNIFLDNINQEQHTDMKIYIYNDAFNKAAKNGHTAIAIRLLDDVDLQKRRAILSPGLLKFPDPFVRASECGFLDIVEKFITGVNPYKIDFLLSYDNFSSFAKAAKNDHIEVIKLLLTTQNKGLINYVETNKAQFTPKVQVLIDEAIAERNNRFYCSLVSTLFNGLAVSAILIGAAAIVVGTIGLLATSGTAVVATDIALIAGGAISLSLGSYYFFSAPTDKPATDLSTADEIIMQPVTI